MARNVQAVAKAAHTHKNVAKPDSRNSTKKRVDHGTRRGPWDFYATKLTKAEARSVADNETTSTPIDDIDTEFEINVNLQSGSTTLESINSPKLDATPSLVDFDYIYERLDRKYGPNGELILDLDNIKPLCEITASNTRAECKRTFHDKNKKPQPDNLISDPYYMKRRELRQLGKYFLEGGINGRTIEIEVKKWEDPLQKAMHKEILLKFPQELTPYQRESTISVIKRLAPGYEVKNKLQSVAANIDATSERAAPKKTKIRNHPQTEREDDPQDERSDRFTGYVSSTSE